MKNAKVVQKVFSEPKLKTEGEIGMGEETVKLDPKDKIF